jgi:hypothetical protein
LFSILKFKITYVVCLQVLKTLLIVVILAMEFDVSFQQQCPAAVNDDNENIGYALTNAVYKSFTSITYAMCLLECEKDAGCMSINFLMTTRSCNLNTQTKESRPELYEERHNSIYSTNSASRIPRPGEILSIQILKAGIRRDIFKVYIF